MTTNNSEIAKIKRRWERAEFWFEIASVVGGLMVGVGLWIEGETTIGQRLITGGVAIEVICAWWVLVASRKLQNILETGLEIVRLETAEANQRAAEATLELARIERRFAARRLARSSHDRIVSKLRLYAPRRVVIVAARSDDPEANDLVEQVGRIFKDAGWNSSVTTDPQHFSRGLMGMLVFINKDLIEASPQLGIEDVAKSIILAFAAENVLIQGPLSVPSSRGGLFTDSLDAPTRVVVGGKPDFTS